MVTETDLRPIIQTILDAFPTFDQWFCNLSDEQREGMRDSWTRQLATLQPSDVKRAADGILDGRVPLPKNYEFDRLGFELRTWGQIEAAKRIEAAKTEQLRDQATRPADPSVRGVCRRFGPAIKCATSWGHALRDGHVTQEQNDEAIKNIHRYHKQGDVNLTWPVVPAKEHKSIVDFWKV